MNLCILEDEIPRDGGRWPEYASTVLLCFDGWEDGAASGRLWSFYFKEPRPFRGLDGLLLALEAVMDEAGQPAPWCEQRELWGKRTQPRRESPASQARSLREPYYSFDGLDAKCGALCTVAVRVYARQHASIQGVARFPGVSPAPVCFRSALELLHLLRDRLERADAGGTVEG